MVRAARCTLGILGASRRTSEPEEVTVGSELAVVALAGTIRVLLVDELPMAKMISVEPQFAGERAPIDVPVVPLDVVRDSGVLRSAAAALAERLLQRASG